VLVCLTTRRPAPDWSEPAPRLARILRRRSLRPPDHLRLVSHDAARSMQRWGHDGIQGTGGSELISRGKNAPPRSWWSRRSEDLLPGPFVVMPSPFSWSIWRSGHGRRVASATTDEPVHVVACSPTWTPVVPARLQMNGTEPNRTMTYVYGGSGLPQAAVLLEPKRPTRLVRSRAQFVSGW
jgi:hypothetical protein